jgi:hypothetical protein
VRKIEGSILVLGVAAVLVIQVAYPQKRLKDSIVFGFNEDIVTYPADFLRLVSFGYGHAAGSLLWLRFLQQTPPKKVEANELSWIYHDLDTVTELDPDFYPAYEHGGIFLSVITEDKRGAEKIFLKGVRHFPDRWRIRAYLAYHYRWELNEPEKAAEQYLAAKDLPDAPPVLKVYAASAMARRGNAATAIYFLRGVLENTKDPSARKRIEDKIKAISKEAM